MKKIIPALAVLVLTALRVAAAQPNDPLTISNLKLDKQDNNVAVSFTLHVDRQAVRSDYTLVSIPALVNGHNRIELTPITVEGRRAGIEAERIAMSHGIRPGADSYITRNGSQVNYTATVPYSAWMENSELRLEQHMRWCCSQAPLAGMMLAQNNIFVIPEPVPIPEPVEPVKTTGDNVAENYRFIAHVSELTSLDDDYFDRFIRGSRDGSLIFHFRQGRHAFERDYRDNYNAMNELLRAVRAINSSQDSRVVQVVIAGFASPEGPTALNNRLALERADAVKRILTENNIAITDSQIHIYNGGVDWQGLRYMVAQSDMAERERVLYIIDTVDGPTDQIRNNERYRQLRNLAGGRPYRHMFENFFPDLRNAAYIKIYYENK